ncbi:MAG TPA: YncE family protein [Candidatus Angelobacter sp.]
MKALKVQRVAIAIFVLLLSALALAAVGGYHQIGKYSFPAAQGSTREYFDYITVDPASRRVYLSHGTEIIVIDADTGATKGAITGLKQDHGVAFAPEFNRGFITDGGDGKVVIFDLKTLKKIGEANADKDADSVVYDPASKRVFAMNGDPHSSTVIDAKTGKVVATIDLGGGPEFAVADGKGTVYVNIEDKDELVAIDSKSLKIKSRWPLAPAGAPTALAIDLAHRRLFSAGRKPQMLVVLDANSGKVIQSFPISGGVDAAAYDPETGLIFASTREGKIHIFHQDSPDKYSEVETVTTAFGAKTLGLDTRKHTVFVDTADFSQPARSDGRPTAIPGTFRVLVYGR